MLIGMTWIFPAERVFLFLSDLMPATRWFVSKWGLVLCGLCGLWGAPAAGQQPSEQPTANSAGTDSPADESSADDPSTSGAASERQSSEAAAEQARSVVAKLQPLFEQIRNAKSTRASVQLAADTVIDGAVVNSETSVYQIASTAPNALTVYLKDAKQRTRIYNNKEQATVALATDAYTNLESPLTMQQAVFGLPVAMGPYPEPVLALTLAGVDPALTLTTGMKSVRFVGEEKFRGKTLSNHFTGVQDDDVTWDLWITRDESPKPLRLRIDLTQMLRQNGDLQLPPGYRYALRFDFTIWLMNHRNDPDLFRYKPIEKAKEYDSVQAYYQSLQSADESGQ